MSDATRCFESLGLTRQMVGIAFRKTAPEGIERIDEPAVSGCSYWKLAAAGRCFYTDAGDHFGCPIGAHTHGIDLPEENANELQGLVGTMVDLQYIDAAEIPDLPRRDDPFGVAIYGPLVERQFEPDVVLISGNPKQIMLLAEAAHAAGLASDSSVAGRPTCAAIPVVLASGRSAMNLGCIGNRTYTDLPDDELYFIVPAARLADLGSWLEIITHANRELGKYHRGQIQAG